MKIKDSSIKSAEKFQLNSFDEMDRIYCNIDETGMKEYLIPNSFSNYVMAYMPADFELLQKLLITSEESEQLEVKESNTNQVSEEFALKTLALVMNKEKYSDLK